jgi:hypothetical protein
MPQPPADTEATQVGRSLLQHPHITAERCKRSAVGQRWPAPNLEAIGDAYVALMMVLRNVHRRRSQPALTLTQDRPLLP